jgi:uncharacterized protein (PEP-CTERM system associated)
MHRICPILAAALALLSLSASPSAQAPTPQPAADTGNRPVAGWHFTPSFIYGGTWGDNALFRGKGDTAPGDYTTTVNPRGELAFHGRRNEFSADYSSTFFSYRQLTPLNSFDQRGLISARRLMTRRVTLFGRASATSVPTTDLVGFVGVPFVRLGSRLADVRAGVEAALTKRTSMVASYNVEWVNFDHDPLLGLVLLGGRSQGASLSVRHALGGRTALIADYDLHRAIVDYDPRSTAAGGDRFVVENTQAGLEYRPWESTRVYWAIGVSRLDVSGLAPRTGPSWSAGLKRQLRTTFVDVAYSRSFVPSYGFGGTTENEQLTSSLTAPIGRRFYMRSSVSWRRNEPLTVGGLKLTSTWIGGSVGYTLRPWMRLEGYYDGTRQNIDRPGGRLDRNRAGFQIVTAKPMRIR